MKYRPVKELNRCSFKDCSGHSSVIIQKTVGENNIMYGYCKFHAIISATFFSSPNRRMIEV